MGNRGKLVLVLVLIASLALTGTAEAKPVAKKGLKQITRTAAVSGLGNGKILTATATCPKKTRALGGGFAMVPPAAGVLPLLQESQMAGRRAWRATVQLYDLGGGTVPTTLTASVNCRHGAPRTSTVSAAVPVPDPGTSPVVGPSATALCPAGRMLIAGGFLTGLPLQAGNPTILLIDSRPDAHAWTSRVISLDQQNTLTSFAYCAPKRVNGVKPVPPRRITRTIPGLSSASGDPRLGIASCGGKGRPIAGGFSQYALLGTGGGYFLPLSSARSARTWEVNAIQVGPSTEIALHTSALCL